MECAWEGTHTKTHEEYVIRFDNGTCHHSKTLRDAIEFCEHMGGTGIYGKPIGVYKRTTVTMRTFELVQRFDVV